MSLQINTFIVNASFYQHESINHIFKRFLNIRKLIYFTCNTKRNNDV